MSFSSLGLPPYLQAALAAQNFAKAYPIQEMAIPAILAGRDLLGIAPTGSGKTASYVLPILARLEQQRSSKIRHASVLVLVPTRELAVQVVGVFQQFAEALPFPCKALAVYGGVSANVQRQALTKVDVLVATPGRLLDLLGSNAVHLSAVSVLVLDEADKMLNVAFTKEMDEILGFLPEKRQNLLFSATLSPKVEDVQRVLLDDPLVIKITPEENQIDLINQVAYALTSEEKGPFLRYLIREQNMQQVLIFTSSVHQADVVESKLNKNGIQAKAIHSKKSQGARTESLALFKKGKLRVLVATDLLARGIDIEFLPYVINYELPRSPKDYIHRIGRTGRAENPGEAIAFVTDEDRHHFKVIQKKMKKWVNLTYVSEIDYR
jgi:ATP-dependent RNA helicase RhlE